MPKHGHSGAGGIYLTPQEIKNIQERISKMDESELDALINKFKEYEDRPLNEFRQKPKD